MLPGFQRMFIVVGLKTSAEVSDWFVKNEEVSGRV